MKFTFENEKFTQPKVGRRCAPSFPPVARIVSKILVQTER